MEPSAQDHSTFSIKPGFKEFLKVIRRRKYTVLGTLAAAVACGWLLISHITPLYKASAIIVLDFRRPQVVRMESVMPGLLQGDQGHTIRSELDTISSQFMAEQVVDHLNLVHDPRINALLDTQTLPAKLVGRFTNGLQTWLQGTEETRIEPQAIGGDRVASLRSDLIDALLGSLKVSNDGHSYTIYIEFTSVNPELARLLSQAFADAYLDYQVGIKVEEARSASLWLRERLAELQQQLEVSEQAVQSYREQIGLIQIQGTSLYSQQLAELSSQLTTVRAEHAQSEARLQAAQGSANGRPDAATPVLASNLIQTLRQQEITLRRQEADLAQHYHADYPELVSVRNQLAQLQRRITEEINRIIQSFRNDADTAAVREQTILAAMGELEQKLEEGGRAEVRLRQLEREASANRELYERFLNRLKETTTQENLHRPDARLISRAQLPSVPAYPKTRLLLLLVALGGVFTGIVLAFLRENLDPALHSAREVERLTGLPVLGLMPNLPAVERMRLHDHVLKKPRSSFSEALRAACLAIRMIRPRQAKVILVTSAVPREGKTEFCLSLARSLGVNGEKVLLIDADLRRPRIARLLGDRAAGDIVDLLTGSRTLAEVVQVDDKSGAHYIAARPGARNPQALLGLAALEDGLSVACKIYDTIIIDTPPVMLVADSALVARIADVCIMLVRWGRTPSEVVLSTLRQLATYKMDIGGLILSRVDLRRHAQYTVGENSYFEYSSYYRSTQLRKFIRD